MEKIRHSLMETTRRGMERGLALFIALVLTVALVPPAAYAAEPQRYIRADFWDSAAFIGQRRGGGTVAENPYGVVLQSAQPNQPTFRNTNTRTHLLLTFSKYGKAVSGSGIAGPGNARVLEYTVWQLKAELVETSERNGETVTNVTDVTSACTWSSSDRSGSTLTVSGSGKVTAWASSATPYKVTASYRASVTETDGRGNQRQAEKVYSAAINFTVVRLSIRNGDEQALQNLALTYLAANEWESMKAYQRSTVGDWARALMRTRAKDDGGISAPHAASTHAYLQLDSVAKQNSATVLHFIAAAAGSCTIEKAASDGDVKAVLFRNGTAYTLAYGYGSGQGDAVMADYFDSKENNGTRRFEVFASGDLVGSYKVDQKHFSSGKQLYSKLASGLSGLTTTGQYYGGTIAKYVSYLTGCASATFHAPSPIQYVFRYHMTELCRYYSVNKQTSYNDSTLWGKSTMYTMEPGYKLRRIAAGTLPYVDYSPGNETASLSRFNNSLQPQAKRNQHLWNRFVYLGGDENEKFNFTIKANVSCLFGGGGLDEIMVPGKFTLSTMLSLVDWKKLALAKWKDIKRDIAKDAVIENTLGTDNPCLTVVLDGVVTVFTTAIATGSAGAAVTAAGVGLAVNLISFSTVFNNNIIVGGSGSDCIYGQAGDDIYIYSPGDGEDIIFDMVGNEKVFLLGYDNATVKVETDQNTENVHVKADGKTLMTFLGGFGKITVYKGDPFDAAAQSRKPVAEGPKSSYQLLKWYQAKCPVDLLVCDPSGNVVQELRDGVPYSAATEYGAFDVSLVNGEYAKTVCLYEEGYTVHMRGLQDGVMSYSASYADFSHEVTQFCSVEDIPVSKDAVYYAGDDMSEALLNVDQNGDGTIDSAVRYDTVLSFDDASVSLPFGKRYQLPLRITTSSADRDCHWVSTDESVAMVDEEGFVTAIGFGEATVYAFATDGSPAYAACTVTVPQENLSAADFTVSGLDASYAYNGEAINPELEVSFRDMPLTRDADYTVSFSQLVEPGQARAVITGIGAFTGERVLSYEILPPHEPENVEEKVAWIAAQCREEGLQDDWETALWLHDWLVGHANYDYTYTYYDSDGVLLYGIGVCQSYSNAYQLLLDEMGIESKVVASEEMNHAWNMVKIGGEWCHIDCTWDDPGVGGAENHVYFGMNDALLARDHTWNRSGYAASDSLQNYYPLRRGEPVFANDSELEAVLVPLFAAREESITIQYIGTDPETTVLSAFEDWYSRNNWKYGIRGFSSTYGKYTCTIHDIIYTEPWEEPVNRLDNPVGAPSFSMNSPNGNFSLDRYQGNGVVLIFGREGCLNTRGLLERMEAELEALHSNGIEVLISVEAAETEADIQPVKQDYPSFHYCYEQEGLLSAYLEAVDYYNTYDTGWVTYPCVFIINGEGKITYYSTGYVSNLDELVSEAFSTSNLNPLPVPTENQYHSADTGDANLSDIGDGNVKRTLQAVCAESTGVFFLTDSALYPYTSLMMEKWEKDYSHFHSLGMSFVACFAEITEEERQNYPHIMFVEHDEDDPFFWDFLRAVGWDFTNPAYYLCSYYLEHDGHIADYRNGSTLSVWDKAANANIQHQFGSMSDGVGHSIKFDYAGGSLIVQNVNEAVITPSAPVYIATYNTAGKFLGVQILTEAGSVKIDKDNVDRICLLWLDDVFAPKCGAEKIYLSR